MVDFRLYVLQRLSALLMAPLVLTHIGVMIYAIQDGLSAAEILSRTQGSVGWALFYGTFVIAASIHGAIGLRAIAYEWGGIKGAALTTLAWGVFVGLTALGLRSVYAVTAGPA